MSIAHRIETILDMDYVLLLDQGKKLEFGNPKELLENNESEFYKFVNGKEAKSTVKSQGLADSPGVELTSDASIRI